jgi:hypothetical protein
MPADQFALLLAVIGLADIEVKAAGGQPGERVSHGLLGTGSVAIDEDEEPPLGHAGLG